MRARNIKPGFWKNEILAQLDYSERLLFIGLWGLADRDGKLEDRPERIKAEIFPYDRAVKCNDMLGHLMTCGFILRYKAPSPLIWIPHFKDHQNPHPHEAKSKLPDYQGELPDVIKCNGMSLHVTKCNADSLNPDSLNPDSIASQDIFETFWKNYPKKVGKGAAEKAFEKIKDVKAVFEKILASIAAQRESDQWQKEGGQFIPNPATWLNQRRWEDEISKGEGSWQNRLLDQIQEKQKTA